MLKIVLKEGESIDRALKRYKRKFRNTKVMEELRGRKHYVKKSVKKRAEIKKAQHREEYIRNIAD